MTTLHNNPQPFDLNRALNGEPVLLRNGNKAFVKFKMDKPDSAVLIGTETKENVDKLRRWKLDGTGYLGQSKESNIIGMWQEPNIINLRLTLTRNGRTIGERVLEFENDLAATRYLDFLEYAKNLFDRVDE